MPSLQNRAAYSSHRTAFHLKSEYCRRRIEFIGNATNLFCRANNNKHCLQSMRAWQSFSSIVKIGTIFEFHACNCRSTRCYGTYWNETDKQALAVEPDRPGNATDWPFGGTSSTVGSYTPQPFVYLLTFTSLSSGRSSTQSQSLYNAVSEMAKNWFSQVYYTHCRHTYWWPPFPGYASTRSTCQTGLERNGRPSHFISSPCSRSPPHISCTRSIA